jgi:hypothetical protein
VAAKIKLNKKKGQYGIESYINQNLKTSNGKPWK